MSQNLNLSPSSEQQAQLQFYHIKIEQVRERLRVIGLRIQEERGRRDLLEELERGGGGVEGDGSQGREEEEVISDRSGSNSRVSYSSTSSRYIMEQFEQISTYMQAHHKQAHKQPQQSSHLQPKQLINPILAKTVINTIPIYKPRPKIYKSREEIQQWKRQQERNRSVRAEVAQKVQKYKTDVLGFMKERLSDRENYGKYGNGARWTTEANQNLNSTVRKGAETGRIRRKSIFNREKKTQQIEQSKQMQTFKYLSKKYSQFLQKPHIQHFSQNQLFACIQSTEKQYQIETDDKKQLSLQIIPISQKRHAQCLDSTRKQTKKFRNLLKKSQREGKKCFLLAKAIREIGVYEKILSPF